MDDQVVGIATDPVIVSSVLNKGDLIEYQEERYTISRFLRSGVSHTYEVQNPETQLWIQVTVPVVYNENEETYFQVTDLSGDGSVATLKPWAEGYLNGETRTIKVRWDEDAETIRDGLKREDHDLFCTVNKVLGKEVMGDFNLLPKDPPVMRMPDLVMDLIFSSLPLDDLHRCRLATPTWANNILPLPRIINFKNIRVEQHDDLGVVYEGEVRGLCGLEKRKKEMTVAVLPPHVPKVVEASLFNNVEFLYICPCEGPRGPISSHLDNIRNILENCHRTKKFVYKRWLDTDGGNYQIPVWRGIKKFMANNHEHLESVQLWPNLPFKGFLDFKDVFVGNFPFLEILLINLRHYSYVRNLHLLPPSVSFLCLLELSVPLGATDVSWITTNLRKLVQMDLHLKHSHSEGDGEDEVNGSKIAEIASTHPSLKAMYLVFEGHFYRQNVGCGKLKGMKGFLEEELGTEGWNITNNVRRGVEFLELVKPVKPGRNDNYFCFEEWR